MKTPTVQELRWHTFTLLLEHAERVLSREMKIRSSSFLHPTPNLFPIQAALFAAREFSGKPRRRNKSSRPK